MAKTPDRLPAGHQPYDPLVGMRVGGVIGGIAGALLVWLTPLGPWALFAGALAGGAGGYWSERRKLRGR